MIESVKMGSEPVADSADDTPSDENADLRSPTSKRNGDRRKWTSKINILIRRVHLYTGLFLLPWVILYGVTGAMFNHLGLFPRISVQPVSDKVVADSRMAEFPTPQALAEQVVAALKEADHDADITLAADSNAEFTNDILFEVKDADGQHVVHINPVDKTAWIGTQPQNEETPKSLLNNVRNIKLAPNPQEIAQQAATSILTAVEPDVTAHPKALGWTKLNFLANVNGKPARITYVLKDGHVDINEFTGDDGMPLRQFFLRMHTSHGQPPHWNGRMFWSLAVDTMAIAMVCWAVTGVFMWWQLKRTRFIGGLVIALSIITATVMYLNLESFYAATRL